MIYLHGQKIEDSYIVCLYQIDGLYDGWSYVELTDGSFHNRWDKDEYPWRYENTEPIVKRENKRRWDREDKRVKRSQMSAEQRAEARKAYDKAYRESHHAERAAIESKRYHRDLEKSREYHRLKSRAYRARLKAEQNQDLTS